MPEQEFTRIDERPLHVFPAFPLRFFVLGYVGQRPSGSRRFRLGHALSSAK